MALIRVVFEIERELWNSFKALAIERNRNANFGRDNAVRKVLYDELDAHDRLK